MNTTHSPIPAGETLNNRTGPTFSDAIDRHEWSKLGAARYRREYMTPLKPVVISGALEHWPARQKWTLDFFRRQYGGLSLEINARKLTMAELIAEVEISTPAKPAPYLHNHLVKRLPAELQADIAPMPDCTRPNWLEHPLISFRWPLTYIELYIGGAGARFPVLHYDGLHTHAFLMQLQGVKEYITFAPDQTPLMYQKSAKDGRNDSNVDNVETPDLARFPRFAQAAGIRFKLHPGETLFVPSGWWHTARILSPSITVSINGANHANWTHFRQDFCRDYMAGRKAKAMLVAAYLRFVRAYLGVSRIIGDR
jgi:Cupin-like domain